MSKKTESTTQDVSQIGGNADDEVKQFLSTIFWDIMTCKDSDFGFAFPVGRRLVLKDISYIEKSEEPTRKEARVVVEIVVDQDMVNALGHLHGGCSAYLIDICSTMSLSAFEMSNRRYGGPSVSQALNIVYHSPAALHDTLRIVNTTMTVGGRAMSAKSEIWNETHRRLVASGIHLKMHPSEPKAKAQL